MKWQIMWVPNNKKSFKNNRSATFKGRWMHRTAIGRRAQLELLEARVVLAAAPLAIIEAIDAPLVLGPVGAAELRPMIMSGIAPDSPELRIDANRPESPYRGVGSIRIEFPGGPFLCSGTPINATHVLTAAHCVDINSDGAVDDGIALTFLTNGTQLADEQVEYSVTQIVMHPGFSGFDNSPSNDLAVLTLATAVPQAAVYPLIPQDLVRDDVVQLVGYGRSGTGVTGSSVAPSFVTKRSGSNTIDSLVADNDDYPDSRIYLIDFDGPDAPNWFDGGLSLGNEIETTIAPGDSGGPAFLELDGVLHLAGVNTFTLDWLGVVPTDSKFGSIAGGMTLDAGFRGWILSEASMTVPTANDDDILVAEGALVTELQDGSLTVLANDQGLLDGPVLVTIEDGPRHAANFELSVDGTFSYQHDGSENFSDAFSYRVTDVDGQFAIGQVSISILPVSDASPVAMPDDYVVSLFGSGDASFGSVLANDEGLVDVPVTLEMVQPPATTEGFELLPDGTFHYAVGANAQPGGTDSFVYRVIDNDGETSTATVTLRFVDVPVAVDDQLSVDEGRATARLADGSLSVLANDSGRNIRDAVVTPLTGPSHARQFVLNSDGTFRYAHDGSEEFVDSFTYRLTTADQQTDTATVFVTVNPVSDTVPRAFDDVIEVLEGGETNVLADGSRTLRANDKGLNDGPTIISLVTRPMFATEDFMLGEGGRFIYVHDGSENFADSFVYRLADNDGQTDTATVRITIKPVSDETPQAFPDRIVVRQGTTATTLSDGSLSVLGNDLGLADTPAIVTIAARPRLAAKFSLNKDGTFEYTHNGSSRAADSFSYRITDNDGQQSVGVVEISVIAAGSAVPSAVDDFARVVEGGAVDRLSDGSDSVLANDTGLADQPVEVSLETSPRFAAAFVLNRDGTFSYTHDGSEQAEDSFVYRVTDTDGQTDTATVFLTIDSVSDATPNATDDQIIVAEGGTVSVLADGQLSVLANDLGLVDGPLTVTVNTVPEHAASFALQQDGTFTYQHDGSERFADSFTYRVTDRDGESDVATVVIEIVPVSDADPVAVSDFIVVDLDAEATTTESGAVSLLDNDRGLADAPVRVSLERGPSFASDFQLSDDGSFRYRPSASAALTDSFTYRITDNDGQTDTAIVAIVIRDNHAPEAVLSVADITTESRTPHRIEVTYSDPTGVDVESIDAADLIVTDADGHTLQVVLREIGDVDPLGQQMRATYEVLPPGGVWDENANGTYAVGIRANEVRDLAGNGSPAEQLGQFQVAIGQILPRVISVVLNDGNVVYGGVTSVAISFDVKPEIDQAALVVIDEVSGARLFPAIGSFAFDEGTLTARWEIAEQFEVGFYSINLPSETVLATTGVPTNVVEPASGNYQLGEPFFVTWRGDTELDLDVDFADFARFANHYAKKTDAIWEEGDFGADGSVDFADFVFLANNFGKTFDATIQLSAAAVDAAIRE